MEHAGHTELSLFVFFYLIKQMLTKRVDRFDNGSCHPEDVPLSKDNLYTNYPYFSSYTLKVCHYDF